MTNKSNQEKSGKTIYDFLWLSAQTYGIALIMILTISFIGISFLVHKQAEPGTQVSIFNILSYTKALKVEPAQLLRESDVTDSRDRNVLDQEYPYTSVRFAYTKTQRESNDLIDKAKNVMSERGYSIWELENLPEGIFWCNKDYITIVICYWANTSQFTVVAAGPHPKDTEIGNEIKAIYKDITGMSL